MTAPFDRDYSLQSLQKIRVKGHDFNLYVTPRFVPPYSSNDYEAVTALIIRQRAKTAHTFIDVGAHYGFFTVLVGHANPNCRIFAFEPIPVNCEILKRNIELNGICNIRLFQSAVSNRNGNAVFQVSAASDNSGFLANPAAGILRDIPVSVISLDHLIEEIPNRTTLIKIDTEGSERQVLQGMERLVEKVDEVEMIIEFNQRCLRHHGLMPEALLHHIHEMGFSIFFIHDEKGFCERYEDGADWRALMGGKNYKNLYCISDSAIKREELDPEIPILRQNGCTSSSHKHHFGTQCASEDASKPGGSHVQRILFVNHNIAPHELTGTPLTTLHHARGMKAKGLEVGVLIPAPSVRQGFAKSDLDGIPLYRIPKLEQEETFFFSTPTEALFQYKRSINRILQEFRPDVVHVNDYVYMPSELIRWIADSGVPVVRSICNTEEICSQIEPVLCNGRSITLCGGPDGMDRCAECYSRSKRFDPADASGRIRENFSRRFRLLQDLYEHDVSTVIFTTPEFKEYFISFIPVPEEKTRIIPRGFSFPHARPSGPVHAEGHIVKFAFLGSGIPRKGIDVILRALEKLTDTQNFELHVFGEIGHEPFSAWIDELNEKHANLIHIRGAFTPEDLPKIVSEIHCAVVPSYFETYNRVVREMLWSGIPVIATDFFGSSIIKEGVNGHRIPSGDSVALANCLSSLIEDPQRIESLSRGALLTPIPSLEDEVEGFLDIYCDLLGHTQSLSHTGTRYSNNFVGPHSDGRAYASSFQGFRFATLYVDTGHGFNEEESIKRMLPSSFDEEPVTFDFDVGHFSHIRALRFDPIENVPAGIEVLCVTLTNRDGGSVEVAIDGSNAIEARENRFIFTTRDPALYLSLPEQAVDIKSIRLVVKYSADQEYVGLLERTVEALTQHVSSSSLHAKLYIDRGDGFSESSALVLPLPLDSDSGSVSLTFPLQGADPIRALRFDPVENAAAIVEISRIELHAGSLVKPVRIRESNAECILHNRYAFTTDDPSLHLEVPRGMEHAESLVLKAAYSVRSAYVNAIGGIVSACAACNCLKDPAGRRYFAKLSVDSGSGFTEGDALLFELPCDPKTGLIGLDIDLTPYRKIKALRWDPIEHAAPVVELNHLQVYRKGKPIRASVSGTNAKSVCDNILIFASDDPYLEITLPTDAPAADRLHIEYRVLVRNN